MDNQLILLQAKLDEAKSKKNINADLAKIQAKLDRLKLQPQISPKSIANLTKQLEKALNQKINITQEEKIKSIQFQMDNGHGISAYQNRIAEITNALEHYGASTEKVETETASLQAMFDRMNGLSGQELTTQAEKLEQEFKAAQISVEQARLSYDRLMQPASRETVTATLVNVQKLLKNNTRVTAEVRQEWEGYVTRLSSGADIAEKELSDIQMRLRETERSMRDMGKMGLSWTDRLKQFWEQLGGRKFIAGAMGTVLNQLRNIPKEVYAIDTAMTRLYQVTDETDRKYQEFLHSASISAHSLGRSLSSLIDQTASWAKSGFSLDEAAQLARASSIYANISGVDQETAARDITAAMKAFNIEASDSITIVDKLNRLGDAYATSAKDLGDGLSHSASAMAAAGTDMDRTLALLTGGTEITQNASEFGDFLTVSSMRIRGKLLCLHTGKVCMPCYAK
ncbi:MAG: phage tail tape measure protein [bacterium]|nr:phage tail tape measure protein [bacterium]